MPVRHRLPAQERRAAIVEAAIRLFAEKGFRGTTTREIAAAVGVSEPVLYEHFATKRDLYTAIIDAKLNQGVEKFSSALAPFAGLNDDSGFLTRLAELLLSFYDAEPDYLRLLMFSALERHELSDIFYQRHSRAFHDVVVRYLGRRMRQGALRRTHPALAARAFTGMVISYAQACILFKRAILPLERKQVIRGLVRIYLQGMSKEKNGHP